MKENEYQWLQAKLSAKLQHCNGHTGKRREGYEEAILNVKSMLHELHEKLIQRNNVEKEER